MATHQNDHTLEVGSHTDNVKGGTIMDDEPQTTGPHMNRRQFLASAAAAAGLFMLGGTGVSRAAWDPNTVPEATNSGSWSTVWQYSVPISGPTPWGPDIARGYLWIPPHTNRVRGVLVGGMTLIEKHLAQDPIIRKTAAKHDLAIVLMNPPIDLVFHYWENNEVQQLVQMLADLADVSGHPEIAVAPLLTYGHSTGALFARNVAYWDPSRVIAILYIKSGNLYQQQHLPPDPNASIEGVPFIAINGQFEEFGPNGDVPPGESRELQWHAMRDSIVRRRHESEDYLMSMVVVPGAGHYSWSTTMFKYLALCIEKAVQYRLPSTPPPLGQLTKLRSIAPRSGWLTDSRITDPTRYEPAPYMEYEGDARSALWYFDGELARAADTFGQKGFHKGDQFVTFLENGEPKRLNSRIYLSFEPIEDGQTVQVNGTFLSQYPYWHPKAGLPVGSANNPLRYRFVNGSAIQTDWNKFRYQADTFGLHGLTVMVYNPGDGQYRYTETVADIRVPTTLTEGRSQTITFPEIPDQKTGSSTIPLNATSDSDLPVEYYVAYGPAVIRGGQLKLTQIPKWARFPIKVSVMAYQWGRPVEPKYQSAEPVERTFLIDE